MAESDNNPESNNTDDDLLHEDYFDAIEFEINPNPTTSTEKAIAAEQKRILARIAKQRKQLLEMQRLAEEREQKLKDLAVKADEDFAAKRKQLDTKRNARKGWVGQKESEIRNIKPKTAEQRRVNVTLTLQELGCNVIENMANLAMNNYQALGLTEPLKAFDIRAVNTELLKYIAPQIKQIDAVEDPDDLKEIPVFIPRRGDLSGTKPTALLESSSERKLLEGELVDDDI